MDTSTTAQDAKQQLARYHKLNNASLLVLAAFALTCALIYTKTILVPFVLGLFLYSAVVPAVQWTQDRWAWPRPLAVGVTVTALIALCSLFGILMTASVHGFIRDFSQYQQNITGFLSRVRDFGAHWGYTFDVDQIGQQIKQLPIAQMARNLTTTLLDLMGNASLILLFSLFLLFGESKTPKSQFVQKIQVSISQYLLLKSGVSLLTGLGVWILLAVLGVDLAFMFGMLTILLNFIPTFGSIIAIVLPVPVVLLQFGVTWKLWVILALSGGIQFGIGNVLEPRLMGESMDLHPITVLIFLMFWGLVWGIPGMFLAVPITAILKIVLDRLGPTKPIAELLAGRLPS